MAVLTPLPAAASAPRALAAPAAIASRLSLVTGRLSPGIGARDDGRPRVGRRPGGCSRHQRVEQPPVVARLGVPLHRQPEARRRGPPSPRACRRRATRTGGRPCPRATPGAPPGGGRSARRGARCRAARPAGCRRPGVAWCEVYSPGRGQCASWPTTSGRCWSSAPPAATAITCMPRQTPSTAGRALADTRARASSHASRSGAAPATVGCGSAS